MPVSEVRFKIFNVFINRPLYGLGTKNLYCIDSVKFQLFSNGKCFHKYHISQVFSYTFVIFFKLFFVTFVRQQILWISAVIKT